MTDHYYSDEPHSTSDPVLFEATVKGQRLKLYTDHGVFSRGKIDYGTQLLIESVQLNEPVTILDLGCGYGPVGITLALTYPLSQVWMIDRNERAVGLARQNAKKNAVLDRTTIHVGDGLKDFDASQYFQAILLNPPIRAGKETIFRLYREAAEHVTDDGAFYIVIQKKQGADSSERYLQSLFHDVVLIAKSAGYRVYRSRQRK
nr:class I SAM-dependent methyltransferase [Bacilli bacterium]